MFFRAAIFEHAMNQNQTTRFCMDDSMKNFEASVPKSQHDRIEVLSRKQKKPLKGA